MGSKRPYERRISPEEARERYILVLQSRLGFFPAVVPPFEPKFCGRRRRVHVQARPSPSRGPPKPQQHNLLPLPSRP